MLLTYSHSRKRIVVNSRSLAAGEGRFRTGMGFSAGGWLWIPDWSVRWWSGVTQSARVNSPCFCAQAVGPGSLMSCIYKRMTDRRLPYLVSRPFLFSTTSEKHTVINSTSLLFTLAWFTGMLFMEISGWKILPLRQDYKLYSKKSLVERGWFSSSRTGSKCYLNELNVIYLPFCSL